MHGRRSLSRPAALLVLAAITIVSAAVLTGCAWLGKGMEVSDAYKRTNEAKTGAFLTSIEIKAPRHGRQAKIDEYYAASGAFDITDADHPKSHGEITIDGDTVAYVEPGNGRVYVTEDGRTDYVKLEKDDRPEGRDNSESLMDAVARAVVNFRDAPPVTNGVGRPIPAIAADISRAKLCGESLRAAARTINSSELNDDDWEIHISKREQRAGTRWCAKQMPTAPTLTFGIENGLLTDFVLNGSVRDGKRTVTVQLKLQFTGLNQPQTGFIPPKVSKKPKGFMLGATAEKASRSVEDLIDSLPSR
ncbi:MAG: hypothetical protein JHC98_04265 [Thermoleophilaceae bacterium]|nr:hypothetical protein [Thermoleophilaceae bacterium]